MKFGDLKVGDTFTWHGTEYVKTKPAWMTYYGIVNCQGPPSYAGDHGWRFLEDDEEVKCESTT